MNFLHVFTLLVIDIHQNKFISLFLTPFIGLEILTFSGMVSARQLTICHKYFYAQIKDFGRHTANVEMMTRRGYHLERKCLEKENDNTEHTQAECAKCMVAPAIVYTGHERVI